MPLIQEISFEKKLLDSLIKLSNRFDVTLKYTYDNDDNGHIIRVCDKHIWNSQIFQSHKTQLIFNFIEEMDYEPILFLSPTDYNIEFIPTHTLSPKTFIEILQGSYTIDFNILNAIKTAKKSTIKPDIHYYKTDISENILFCSNSYLQGA
ncbi:MAG: hypothetical protein AB8E82_20255 [Aureispira sp.]